MKNARALTALFASTLLTASAFAAPGPLSAGERGESPALTTTDALQQVFLDQAEVDRVTAIIRSRADLKRYLANTPDAPLNKLPARIRHSFIERLTFTPRGLGSYSYSGLTDYLSTTDIYQTLSLFGVQKSVGAIPGLKRQNETDGLIATLSFDNCEYEGSPTCPDRPKTKTDHVCADDWLGDGYKCHYSFGDVCTASCGK